MKTLLNIKFLRFAPKSFFGAMLILGFGFLSIPSQAQDFVQIKNRYLGISVNTENGMLNAAKVQQGLQKATWEIIAEKYSIFIKIRLKGTENYLYADENSNALKIGPIIGDEREHWNTLRVGKTDYVWLVHRYTNGRLSCSNDGELSVREVDDGAWRAHWEIQRPNKHTYTVRLDCEHTQMESEDTQNSVSVSFFDHTGSFVDIAAKKGLTNCGSSDKEFSITTGAIISTISFSIDGSDAFFIDEWRLLKDGVLIVHEGRDDGQGWCLSTDPNDGGGAWTNSTSGICKSSHTFPIVTN